MAHAVFISYASVDKSTANAVCQSLEAAGLCCWVAPRDVVAGTRYAQAIVDAIRDSRAFVLVFSSAANASAQVQREVDRAVSLGLPILPLRIEDVVPSASLEYYLAGQHWLDALTAPLESHLGRLCESVGCLVQPPPVGDRQVRGTDGEKESLPLSGAPIGAPSPSRKERRVVTALCSEISGFSSLSEGADPEDIEAVLRAYDQMARGIVEAHGGAIETFVGDEVVAVFGVPAIHEDDPERAVRAALRMVVEAEDLPGLGGEPLRVRAGINTGEALVRFDAGAAFSGSVLAGDAVNVAARLRSIAPPASVVVGAATRSLTAKAIDYQALDPVTAKGAAERPSAWLAKAPISRLGVVVGRERLTPLVDREAELAYLTSLFEKAVSSSSPAVALIVGEPGIGKSRLVGELLSYVDARAELVTWRQGHCLSYGEGVTFWALSEIVKAQAGILETDDTETVQAKLESIVPGGPDREWLRNRLRALLGLPAPQASRDENFTAWLRFLEGLAVRGPAVLVFEDLHWADEALLAFLEFLAGNVDDVPLFVLATARPQLFEKSPAFAASIARVNRITLERLSDEETEQLVSGALETASAPSQVVGAIIRRCEGNPFYAEESVRLFNDKVPEEASRVFESADEGAAGRGDAEAALPGTVQAVIAARLDTLPPDRKELLADAAVVGTVFWSGALAALSGRDRDDVDAALRCLAGKQLLHRARSSSMAGENEYAFWHVLARDVAYKQLPRAARAEKHAAVAAWIEGKVGERVEDLAEVLVHHYTTALGLTLAAGRKDLADSLVEPAVRFLSLAGDQARPLDLAAAESLYARALELAGSDSRQRPRLLVKWARAVTQLGRPGEAIDAFAEAIARLTAEGDVRAVAVAKMGLAYALPDDEYARCLRVADEAVALLEADGPSPELVTVLVEWLEITGGQGASRSQLEVAERAIKLSEELGLPVDARVVADRGAARCDLGDAGGLDDLKRSLEMCRTSGLGEYASQVFWTAGTWVYMYEGFHASLAILTEGLEIARRRGALEDELLHRMAIIWASLGAGEWDWVLDDAVAVEPLLEAGAYVWALHIVRLCRTLALVGRGRTKEAEEPAARVEERAQVEIGHTVAGCRIAAAAARMAVGDSAAALDLLAESEAPLRGKGGYWWADCLPMAVRTALGGGDRALAERLSDSIEPLQPLSRHAIAASQAMLAEARGEHEAASGGFADAARRWHGFEMPYEEAQALLGQGRCLVALDRAPEAAAPLAAAREIFARLKARPALEETDSMLASVREQAG